jgi:uncharacterized protein involved in exopolysaccharide biosynthesis
MMLSFFSLSALALRNRWLLLGLPLVTVAVGVLLSRTTPPQYVAETRFAPQRSEQSGGQLAGIAAQFGVNLTSGPSSESIDFYAALLRSRTLLGEIAAMPLARQPASGRAATVADVLAPDASSAKRTTAAIGQLNARLQIVPDVRANLVTVRIKLHDPELAESVLARLLELVQQFNIEKRQTSAAAERSFVEDRLQEAERELREAEGALEAFMDRNRRWRESPQLSLAESRLQSRVDLRREVFISLSQSFERARIDEVRNTPVFTVLDPPAGSARRTGGTPLLVVVVGLVLGFGMAVAIVATREFVAAQRERDPAGWAELRRWRQHGTQAVEPSGGRVRAAEPAASEVR